MLHVPRYPASCATHLLAGLRHKENFALRRLESVHTCGIRADLMNCHDNVLFVHKLECHLTFKSYSPCLISTNPELSISTFFFEKHISINEPAIAGPVGSVLRVVNGMRFFS